MRTLVWGGNKQSVPTRISHFSPTLFGKNISKSQSDMLCLQEDGYADVDPDGSVVWRAQNTAHAVFGGQAPH